MNVLSYVYNIISGRTSKQRSIDNVMACSDWTFIQLGHYTSATPLIITQGSTTKLTFQQNNISYTVGRDLNVNYDYNLQKFIPQTVGDVFLVEIRFKIKCSVQNGNFDVLLESPTVSFNPIQAQSTSVSKVANTEQFVSMSVPVFIGKEVKDNGLEVKVSALSGNLSVYDISFMIVRMTSGIPIAP